jgi:hypothetical protein
MNKRITLSLVALLLPGIASSDVVDEAAKAMCDCGAPPRSDCMSKLVKRFPQIDSSLELQDQVMDKYQQDCVAGMSAPTSISTDAKDCSTSSFTVEIPKGWKCRKMGANPQDVTLYAYGNKLNVSLGKNQGQTSCSVIPVCKSAKYELSSGFETSLFTNPMIGTHEYAGHFKQDSSLKLTITSNTQPTKTQLNEIKVILDSFKKR